uniref:Protein TRANSPARENT TESTA 12 n=1 Tax=Aegilops tauschii subsp. strangulata TaxID=200361 RepID=A0A453BU18_AEGTS
MGLISKQECEISSMSPTMEEPLVGGNGSTDKTGGPKESLVVTEVKKQLYLAGPLIAGCLLQNVVQMISVMFVGHLGWHGEQLGHTVWASLRGETVLSARHLQAEGDPCAHAGERCGCGGLGLHRADPPALRPGPGDRHGGGELHPVDDSGTVRLRAAAVPRPVPPDAEHCPPGDGELGRHGAEPRARVLVAGVQAWAGQQGRCPGQRHLVPGQRVNPGSLHQALSILQEHLDRGLKGGVPRHR